MERLVDLVGFMKNGGRIGAKSPLMTLDLIYSQILADVSQEVLPVTRRILGQHMWAGKFGIHPFAVQSLCNFLHLEQREFYNALRKLYSVMDVPPPEKAGTVFLRAYHASFLDYLREPVRSGRFCISIEEARLESSRMCLFWYQAALAALPATDGTPLTMLLAHSD